MPTQRLLALALLALSLQGCVAKAVASAVTLPVKAVSRGVDLATESQSEADEKRGRAIRKREERLGQLDRAYAREIERCAEGDREACDKARAIRVETWALMRGVAVEPDRR
jgi:hypothetical protein